MLATATSTKSVTNQFITELDNLNSVMKKAVSKGTGYTYCDNEVKALARTLLISVLETKFPINKFNTIKTTTLGGETLPFENTLIKRGYKLNGLSYEYEDNLIPIAEQHKPKGITIVNDTIFNHKYAGEQLIWFDTMDTLRPKYMTELLNWIANNKITNDCVFAVTYTLHSRVSNMGYKQLFNSDEDTINEFIYNMGNYIALYLENDIVKVEPNYKVARYKNKNKAMPMVQYIFTLSKK